MKAFCNLTRNRLAVFLAIALLLFLLAPPAEDERIRVTAQQQEVLQMAKAASDGVAELSAAKKIEVTAQMVDDEVLYREGLRLQLDKNDPIIKQRIVQKMLALAEDLSGKAAPESDKELRAYYEAHKEFWRKPMQLRFVHIFSRSKRGLGEVRNLARVRYGGNQDDEPALGEEFPLPRVVGFTTLDRLREQFGVEFAASIGDLKPGIWSRPIESRYGNHLVKIIDRRGEGVEPFDSIVREVRFRFLMARREAGLRNYLEQLKRRYPVDIEELKQSSAGSSSDERGFD